MNSNEQANKANNRIDRYIISCVRDIRFIIVYMQCMNPFHDDARNDLATYTYTSTE
jgi:hypothetical protein